MGEAGEASTRAPKEPLAPPEPYVFSEADQTRFANSFWRCPVRLVTGGRWAALWRRAGTVRGGGAASSLLPVLALHGMPEAGPGGKGWTQWFYLSRRRIARLAGLDKDTATAAISQLLGAGLVQVESRLHERDRMRGHLVYYRLSAGLYPVGGERFTTITGAMVYGGTWSLLPTSACRHLYLVLAARDPIGDESAYVEGARRRIIRNAAARRRRAGKAKGGAATSVAHEVDDQTILAHRRAKSALSLARLADISGTRRSTLAEALRVLVSPVPDAGGNRESGEGCSAGTRPLVRKGSAVPRSPTWYAPDRSVRPWMWPVGFLNDPQQVRELQRRWVAQPAE
ncbi:MAG: hypothetical protein M3409_03785 [Gemmatimonadota bacterium]|nr:hypothetical protein [Gemmatimonadota bacterium]